jgi:Zn finger protein HypA/HybF involved in hydrogenase expression
MSFFKKLKEKVTSPKASLSMKLNKNTYALGEKLEGTLTVASEEEIDATEIRAELRCEEKKKTMRYDTETVTLSGGRTETRPVWREEWVTETIFSENPQGSGPIHLSARYKGDFPFSTSIPAGGQPSYSGGDRSITWTVKGVIGVKGRPDVTSSAANIQAVAASIASVAQTVVTEKIVEREIVMIPCQYCSALFPQTTTTCPKCGAQRKA